MNLAKNFRADHYKVSNFFSVATGISSPASTCENLYPNLIFLRVFRFQPTRMFKESLHLSLENNYRVYSLVELSVKPNEIFALFYTLDIMKSQINGRNDTNKPFLNT